MAAPLLIAAAGIGTALQVYGTWKAGQEDAEALRRDAGLDRLRAAETLERNVINNELVLDEAGRITGRQKVAFAGSGRAQSASTIRALDETIDSAFQQIELNNRDAQWDATMLRLGADSSDISARQVERASKINAIGQLFVGGVTTFDSSAG